MCESDTNWYNKTDGRLELFLRFRSPYSVSAERVKQWGENACRRVNMPQHKVRTSRSGKKAEPPKLKRCEAFSGTTSRGDNFLISKREVTDGAILHQPVAEFLESSAYKMLIRVSRGGWFLEMASRLVVWRARNNAHRLNLIKHTSGSTAGHQCVVVYTTLNRDTFCFGLLGQIEPNQCGPSALAMLCNIVAACTAIRLFCLLLRQCLI